MVMDMLKMNNDGNNDSHQIYSSFTVKHLKELEVLQGFIIDSHNLYIRYAHDTSR